MANETAFGQWLRQQRKALDLTQEDLAMRIDCSWETVRKIESGDRHPSKQVAELIADFLRISPEDRPAFQRFARSDVDAEHFLSLPKAAAEPSHIPNNLPSERSTFIGRESAIASVCALLRRPAVRLLTLTGPAGIGKTRLSLQVAGALLDEFPGGVFLVQLAPVTDPDFVALAIVQTLGATQSPDQPAVQRLKEYLRDRHMLLVLDNFEQVVQAGPLVAQLLEACPKLKVLVSSRTVLRVYGEHEYPVQPMSLPNIAHLSTPDVLEQYEAVELFVHRSEAVKPGFVLTEGNAPAVVEICYRLDGLPLAIELAAARSNILSPAAIVARLGNRLKLLTLGAEDLPARQRTLRNAIAWSYDLLDGEEKALFARLGVFTGGCMLEAAEAVVGDGGPVDILDKMTSLVGKSLLVQQEGVGGEPRFSMLETIREYALEKLEESGEAEEVQRRHTAYFLELAESAEPNLTSAERADWLARLDRDLDNIRAVLTRCQSQHDVEASLRLAGALSWFWYFRSYLIEGCGWLERALSAAPTKSSATAPGGSMARAKALNGLARLLARMSRYNDARPWLEESVAICRQMGERTELAFALALLGLVATSNGEHEMISMCEESVALFEDMGDKWGLAYALDMFADASGWINPDRMEPLVRRSLALYRELGDQENTSTDLSSLGSIAQFMGDYSSAIRYFDEALEINYALGDRWNLALSFYALAQTSHLQGDRVRARALYEQSIPMFRELGRKSGFAGALRFLAHLAQDDADYARALSLTRESLTLARQLDNSTQFALGLAALGGLAAAAGHAEYAAVLFGAADAHRLEQALRFFPLDRSRYARHLALVREALSEEVFGAAWERGRAMSLDEAFKYALATSFDSLDWPARPPSP
jgi:predicted ATPase/transcriptional regulator with XRE-family HTH domain